jgi:hypothetical protein
MASSRFNRFRLFCRKHFPHFTYPRRVFDTWKEPQKIHFLPLSKLAAQLKMFVCRFTIGILYIHLVTKQTNYLSL